MASHMVVDLQMKGLRGFILSHGVAWRTSWLHLPYGDQAIFIERQTLEALGGFKEWPLLEDVEMVRRLQRLSPPAIVQQPVTTSARRWEKLGFWQTALMNQAVLAGYTLGVDVHTLAGWYEATGIRGKNEKSK